MLVFSSVIREFGEINQLFLPMAYYAIPKQQLTYSSLADRIHSHPQNLKAASLSNRFAGAFVLVGDFKLRLRIHFCNLKNE